MAELTPRDRSEGTLWRQWRALRWHEQLAIAITGTSALAWFAVASVFAALCAQLLFDPGGEGGAQVVVVPVAVLIGALLLGQLALIAILGLLQGLAIWLALQQRPTGYLIAGAGLAISALIILRVGEPTALALRAPLAGMWLAGAGLALASYVSRRAR
jgi:hypothetical protein